MSNVLWDRIARSYDSRFRNIYVDILAILGNLVEPDDTVLEIGSGTGLVSFNLIPLVSHFVGLDISDKMVEIANEKLDRTEYTHAEFHQMDIMEASVAGTFSKVLLVNVLHIVDDPRQLLHKVKESLSHGTELILITFCHGEKLGLRWRLMSSLMRLAAKLKLMGTLHIFKFEDVDDIVADSGYKVVERRTVYSEFPFICYRLEVSHTHNP